jgi:hypothetical protein
MGMGFVLKECHNFNHGGHKERTTKGTEIYFDKLCVLREKSP